jgi:hypothetical protein
MKLFSKDSAFRKPRKEAPEMAVLLSNGPHYTTIIGRVNSFVVREWYAESTRLLALARA